MKNPFKGYKWYAWVIILFMGFLLLSRLAPVLTPLFSGDSGPSRSETATVVRVIDGDTIEVDLDGWRYTVRYIGINTPETNRPSRGVEFYGPEASARNRELVEGKTVRMEFDVSSTDRFDRLLGYVYVDDEMVNATLISEGFAVASTFPPDTKFADRFENIQMQAMEIPSNPFQSYAPMLIASILTAMGWGVTGKRPNTCTIIEPPLCMKFLPSTMTAL